MQHLIGQWNRRIAEIITEKMPQCPRCGSDLHVNDDPNEPIEHFEGDLIYRGVNVKTEGAFATADPIALAEAFKQVRYIGEHFSRDSNIALNNFALPGPGRTGFFIAVRGWKCEDRIDVSPGYSHEQEIAFRPGAPMRLSQLRVYPDPDLRGPDYNKWGHEWNVQSHFGYDVVAGDWRVTAGKTSGYSSDLIARGLVIDQYPESFANKVASGTATADDFLRYIEGDHGVGIWWGVMGVFGDLPDFEDYAYGSGDPDSTLKGMIEEGRVGADYIAGEIGVVLIAKRPTRNGEPWDPEKHNELDPLMGNSYVDPGERLQVIEVRYDAGWGWKSLPANKTVTADIVPDFKSPDRNMSKRQVEQACQRILKDMAKEFGYTDPLPDIVFMDLGGDVAGRFVEPDRQGWGGKPYIALDENWWMDNAQSKDYGYSSFRILAHEAVHALFAGYVPGGTWTLAHDLEEAGAEVLSLVYWAKNAPKFDDRDRVMRGDDRQPGQKPWTDPGVESMARSINYDDLVASLIRRAATQVGWDQQRVFEECQRLMRLDRTSRHEFWRDTPEASPPSGVQADGKSLALWLITGFIHHSDVTAAVRKQYLRFGRIPEGGTSINGFTMQPEAGVSVYELDADGFVIVPSETWAEGDLRSRLREVQREGGELLLVTGTEIGRGADGEPLLADVEVLHSIEPEQVGVRWVTGP